MKNVKQFSTQFQERINQLLALRKKTSFGQLEFDSPFLLAPMASITSMPYRLLMQDLGAGGGISELISSHGINYQNERTRRMLSLNPSETHTGSQLFGEDAHALSQAASLARDQGAKFIDINMGCPVKKVVTKGGGAALMRDPTKLSSFFKIIKKGIDIPLTIKIRTGWDEKHLTAYEVVKIAENEGIEFVSLHGRTRNQQYSGEVNWDYIEEIAEKAAIPLVGNGDLHSPEEALARFKKTKCQGLMFGRGPLKNPFFFLEIENLLHQQNVKFTNADLLEVLERLFHYVSHYYKKEHIILLQMQKHIVSFSSGHKDSSKLRNNIFSSSSLEEVLELAEEFFTEECK